MSTVARSYLTTALDDIQQHALDSQDMNWPQLRQQVFTLAQGAQTTSDTYTAIRYALQLAGTQHSLLYAPNDVPTNGPEGTLAPDEVPQGQHLASGIGYLKLPHVFGSGAGFQQAAQHYGVLAQQAIRQADQAGTCGWIVDLRGNFGGDMWPMLVGVGPILGAGTAGSFVFPNGTKQSFSYANGQAQLDGVTLEGVPHPYQLKQPSPPVAVLTGGNTASSGEAIVVAFRGRPDTQGFGMPTAGDPTVNQDIVLSDGALMLLTEAVDADRTGQTYRRPIQPDHLIYFTQDQVGSAGDPVMKAAASWLQLQSSCQK
jgi:C-terminal processing protease CtpA/Prc